MEKMWNITQKAEGILELYIYGEVKGDGFNWWTEEVIKSETSANHFKEELAKYPNITEIRIFINSCGGSVFEGTAIYNQLRRHTARKVVTVDGFACSIASVIAMAGDEVIMPRNALMMVHNMAMGIYGNPAELRKAADDLDVINASGRNAYLAKAGDKLEESKLRDMMDKETWLTAEQCIELGLADRYADADADMSNAAEVVQRANLSVAQRIEIQRSLVSQLNQMVQRKETPAEPDNPILRFFERS